MRPPLLAAAMFFALALAPPARAEPITLTVGQAEELLNGLASIITPREVILKEGAAERAVKVHPKGWSLGVIMAITKNIDALKPGIITWHKATDQRRLDLAGEDGKISIDGQRKLARELEDKRAETQSYDLTRFKAAELKPDTNEISPAALSAIRPVLTPE